MKTDEKQIRHGVALLAVTILILAITGGYMAIDRYLVGDEVVTYGMANSTDKGWMLSTGRIRAYFEDEILTDSVAQTIQNIAAFGMDLAKNRRGAAYFSYPRPEECGWYGKEQISDWFSIREDERLHLGDVYLNAMMPIPTCIMNWCICLAHCSLRSVQQNGVLFWSMRWRLWRYYFCCMALPDTLLRIQKDNFWCACCSGARWAAWI